MKDFLKKLGLEDDVVGKIIAEHDRLIQAEKDLAAAESGKLKTAEETLKTLQEKVKAFDGVDVKKLQEDFKTLQGKYDSDLAQAKLDHALEMALVGSKARNSKAVKALLELDKIKLGDDGKLSGLDEQLTKLKSDADYLFELSKPSKPIFRGVKPGETGKEEPDDKPDTSKMTYEELAAYYADNPEAEI